jgi:hypothetical protein
VKLVVKGEMGVEYHHKNYKYTMKGDCGYCVYALFKHLKENTYEVDKCKLNIKLPNDNQFTTSEPCGIWVYYLEYKKL